MGAPGRPYPNNPQTRLMRPNGSRTSHNDRPNLPDTMGQKFYQNNLLDHPGHGHSHDLYDEDERDALSNIGLAMKN